MPKVTPTKTIPMGAGDRLGTAGTPVYGGWVTSVEKNPKLSGQNKYKKYSEMFTNTSIVAAGVRYFLNVVTNSAWKLEAANESEEAKNLAKLMESIIHDMRTPWHRIVRKAVMYRFYGFSIGEITAKVRDDGYIGIADIESRPQRTVERWDVDDGGVVKGIWQRSPQDMSERYIPRWKFVYFIDDSLSDSPEGFGLFRHLVDAADRLARYEQLEGFGYETDLRGVPIGRAPIAALKQLLDNGEITQKDFDDILKPMKDFIENHIKGPKLGMLLDSTAYAATNEAQTPSTMKHWDLELLKGGSESLKDISTAIQRLNGELARILGVEGLLLGGQGRGSQALSQDKSDNFFIVVDSALRELSSTMTHDLIDYIWMLNGLPRELKPKFKTDSIKLRDIEQITGALKDMAASGAVMAPDDPAINEVRDLLGLGHASTDTAALDATLIEDKNKKPDQQSA